MRRLHLLVLIPIFCSSCAIHTKYSRPAIQSPQSFGEMAGSGQWKTAEPSDTNLRGKWWEIFGDAQLNAGGVDGATYYWSGPNFFYAEGPNPVLHGVSIFNSGDYWVKARIGYCYSDSVATNLLVKSDSTCQLGDNGVCYCECNYHTHDRFSGTILWPEKLLTVFYCAVYYRIGAVWLQQQPLGTRGLAFCAGYRRWCIVVYFTKYFVRFV